MTVIAAHHPTQAGNSVGERVELARYAISSGDRILHGQRVNGVVRVTDVPATGNGRSFLVERELEQDGNAALNAMVADYVQQAHRLDAIPMAKNALGLSLETLRS